MASRATPLNPGPLGVPVMINARENTYAWASFLAGLAEAGAHLSNLIDRLVEDGEIDDDDLSDQLALVYGHLNRAWHSRNQEQPISDEQWASFSRFPADIDPVA